MLDAVSGGFSRLTHQRALTLIEFFVAIAIISLLATILVPVFGSPRPAF